MHVCNCSFRFLVFVTASVRFSTLRYASVRFGMYWNAHIATDISDLRCKLFYSEDKENTKDALACKRSL